MVFRPSFYSRSRSERRRDRRSRSLAFEPLEARYLLSVTLTANTVYTKVEEIIVEEIIVEEIIVEEIIVEEIIVEGIISEVSPDAPVVAGDGTWQAIYDLDFDGRVGFGDLAFFASAFLSHVDDPVVDAADFDRSGRVDFSDFALFAANFGRRQDDGLGDLVLPAGLEQENIDVSGGSILTISGVIGENYFGSFSNSISVPDTRFTGDFFRSSNDTADQTDQDADSADDDSDLIVAVTGQLSSEPVYATAEGKLMAVRSSQSEQDRADDELTTDALSGDQSFDLAALDELFATLDEA